MKYFVLILFSIFIAFLNAKTIELATTQWPPFEYEEKGVQHGTDVEVIKETFKRMGKSLKIKFYPWKRAIAMMKEKRIDGIFTLRKTDERQKFMVFPNEVLSYSENVFFYKAKYQNKYKYTGNLEDLKDQIICLTAGYAYGDEFMKSKLFTRDVGAHSDEQNFKKLDVERGNLFLCDKLVGLHELSKLKLNSKISFLPTPLSNFDMFLAFKKGNENLANEFSKELANMKKDGSYQKIINRYLK